MKSLFVTYIALVVILSLTYGASYLPLGTTFGTLASLGFALMKAALIVRVFMAFGRAGPISNIWFFVGLAWLAILSSSLLDYVARPWDARPRSWTGRSKQRVMGSGPDSGEATPLGGK